MSKKLGLTLSGGGYRGAAHIGFLQRLQEQEIKIDILSGTSSGALIAALYVNGTSPQDMLEFLKNTSLFSYKSIVGKKIGLLKTSSFRSALEKHFHHDDIAAYTKRLSISATNLLTGEEQVRHTGSLVDAILSSCAYPGVFVPHEVDDVLYGDGGMVNNFPTDSIVKKCDILLGMNVSPVTVVEKKDISSTFGMLKRVYEIVAYKHTNKHEKLCDICLTPEELGAYNIFDKSIIDEAYELGYTYAKKHGKKIKKIVQV